jgi:Spy/CpxP family protein refolding chaperone
LIVALTLAGVVAVSGLAWAGHGWGRGGSCRFGQRFARLHAEFAVDRALKVAEATPEQRARVEELVEKAFAEHAHYQEAHQALHEEAIAILSAGAVDRARLEALRARHLEMADRGSRQVTTAVADIADVLTAEQRQKLAAHARQMFE